MKNESFEKSDEELILSSHHDSSSFQILVDRYQKKLLRKALNMLGDTNDAQEVVQEAFMRMYVHSSKFRVQEGASFNSWAYKILVNTALTYRHNRKSRHERYITINPDLLQNIPNFFQFPRLELRLYIEKIFSLMPPADVELLVDFLLRGKSIKELSEKEGVSENAIKVRIFRAKERFQSLTTKEEAFYGGGHQH